jgi:hypothetical protein
MNADTRTKVEAIESARDPVYVAAVNGLIPLACKKATARVKKLGRFSEPRVGACLKGGANPEPYQHDFWSEFFHQEMNQLKREHGLLP